MGCISSKFDINDQHPNIFQVMNVDEMGHFVSPGQLEITETELVLHQRGKPPTRWPVRCLRKYGFDSEIFSFESGRRCPTGAGIYAFRCRKAEQLFNLLQQNIQLRNLNEDANVPGNVTNFDFPVPTSSTGPPVHRRLPSVSDGYLNPTQTTTGARQVPCLSRPGSVTSNGPASPTNALNGDNSLERNNNKQSEHSYTNTSAAIAPTYINLGIATSPTANESYVNVTENTRLYMNVDTNNTKELPKILTENGSIEHEDPLHCYANIGVSETEIFQPQLAKNLINPITTVENANALYGPQEVNYVELDLETVQPPGVSTQLSVESPDRDKKSYATIDFNRTNALSQSVNPCIEIEEGIRKTRHNSTIIGDVRRRHSNSSSE